MNRVGETEIYSGALYRMTGTWFGAPRGPATTSRRSGPRRFAASTAHRGVLT